VCLVAAGTLTGTLRSISRRSGKISEEKEGKATVFQTCAFGEFLLKTRNHRYRSLATLFENDRDSRSADATGRAPLKVPHMSERADIAYLTWLNGAAAAAEPWISVSGRQICLVP
jgi:hypothetical protein